MNIHLWIAAILAVVTIGFVVLAIWTACKGLHSRSWPRVDATINASTVEETGFDPVSYSLVLEYRYTVNGQTYVGNKISTAWGTSFSWRWRAEHAKRKYAVGTGLSAYYSPGNPADAVLKRGVDASAFASIAAALVLALAACKQYSVGSVGS